MNRNRNVTKDFGLNPRADVPRAAFPLRHTVKTTIGHDRLDPIFCAEVLPTDRWQFGVTIFGRLITPIVPILDNLWIEVFYFFCANRNAWNHWPNFISGRNPDPTDSTTYTIPYMTCPSNQADTYCLPGTTWDKFGLPVYGSPGVGDSLHTRVSALPFRHFAAIYNEWFRDPNWVQPKYGYVGPALYGDGPDKLDSGATDGSHTWLYPPFRYKKKDYFTGSLPWPQASTNPIRIPVTSSNITTLVTPLTPSSSYPTFFDPAGGSDKTLTATNAATTVTLSANAGASGSLSWSNPGLGIPKATLQASLGTINEFRTAAAIQQLLETDARGGPRYVEQLQAHFGILPQDTTLQRPEYLGSAKQHLTVAQVPQTSATSITDSDTPLGELAAYVTAKIDTHITFSAPEHGYIIGVVNLTGDITYQQGVARHWSRSTRDEFYFPHLANLGEQAILTKEIYCPLNDVNADAVIFGYIPRWDELRHWPNQITGFMRSGIPGTLDIWHLAELFNGVPPTNGATFMQQNTPMERILAVDDSTTLQTLKLDILHQGTVTRPLPMFSKPGMLRI